MKLRGIELGNVFLSSGSRNIDGKGWKQDVFFRWHPGFNFSGATPILKTITVDERKGNMIIDPYTLQSKSWFPDCVRVDFIRDRMANAVGLSNPGLIASCTLIRPKIKRRIIWSVACVRTTKEARLAEAREYVDIVGAMHREGILALEVNESCPSIKNSTKLYDGTIELLAIFQKLNIPLIVKLDSLATVKFIRELEASLVCDAIDIPNSLPIYARWDKVNWHKMEYLTRPVFQKYATCGYSSRENFEMAVDIIRGARKAGVTLPIICGGISNINDIRTAKEAGANAVAIGRAIRTRFWRVKSLIRTGNQVFGGGKID